MWYAEEACQPLQGTVRTIRSAFIIAFVIFPLSFLVCNWIQDNSMKLANVHVDKPQRLLYWIERATRFNKSPYIFVQNGSLSIQHLCIYLICVLKVRNFFLVCPIMKSWLRFSRMVTTTRTWLLAVNRSTFVSSNIHFQCGWIDTSNIYK